MQFASIPDAIAAFRAGKMLVVVDDEDRENEGDLTLAAEKATPEAINFMVRHGRGLVCTAMTSLPQVSSGNICSSRWSHAHLL